MSHITTHCTLSCYGVELGGPGSVITPKDVHYGDNTLNLIHVCKFGPR